MRDSGQWVRVEDEAELAPGQTLEERPCNLCSRTERVILTHSKVGEIKSMNNQVLIRIRGWKTAPLCPSVPSGYAVYLRAIREGRLWRYVPPAEEATSTSRREKAGVR